jgi:hypothetical protein
MLKCACEKKRGTLQVFTEMVFVFGDVHCDPHAANMMVKPGEDNKIMACTGADTCTFVHAQRCTVTACPWWL